MSGQDKPLPVQPHTKVENLFRTLNHFILHVYQIYPSTNADCACVALFLHSPRSPRPPLCFYIHSQRSSSEAQCRGSGLRELAVSSDGTDPRGGLCDQPLVSDGLPVATGSCRGLIRGGSAVASAHRENPLAQEVGAGLWGSPELAWWVRRWVDFTYLLYISRIFSLDLVQMQLRRARTHDWDECSSFNGPLIRFIFP